MDEPAAEQFSLMPIMVMPESDYSVMVTNVAPEAIEKDLRDFFSFCGFVRSITIEKEDNGSQRAIIQFWDEKSIETALLLSQALIKNYVIEVHPYSITAEDKQKIVIADPTIPEEIMQHTNEGEIEVQFVDETARKRKTIIVSELAAAGYILAQDTKSKAVNWDHSHVQAIPKIGAAGQAAIGKVKEFDRRYEISLTTGAILEIAAETASYKARELDQAYGISQKVSNAAAAVLSNKGVSLSLSFAEEQKKKIVTRATSFKEETQLRIDEKRKERAVPEPNLPK